MRLAHFFIDRPRFASVLSIFVTAFGLGALVILPVAQYPEIVPPTVRVATSYPGASAELFLSVAYFILRHARNEHRVGLPSCLVTL